MFICEGEVLLLQRNSNNNDLMFDICGGTVDMEDLPELYHQTYGSYPPEYQKELDAAAAAQNSKNNIGGSGWFNFTNFGWNKSTKQLPPEQQQKQQHDAENPATNTKDLPAYKKPIIPQAPALYDSFYFADLFGSQFQNLGLNSYGAVNSRYIKRKKLERLYEQSIRHNTHGYGFDSAMWRAAVRETREEIGAFPDEINPLAVFNIYRGWNYTDDVGSESDDGESEGEDSGSDFDLNFDNADGKAEEKQSLLGGGKKHNKQHKNNKKQDNIKLSLLSNGKLITSNFRRFTLYLVSITPEQRNMLTRSIQLSEEHHAFGWFPLCLLLPMQNTTVSTFKYFALHPWLQSFISQYSQQFEKLSNKAFWVGYNRHFGLPAPQEQQQQQIDDESSTNDSNEGEDVIAPKQALTTSAITTETPVTQTDVVKQIDTVEVVGEDQEEKGKKKKNKKNKKSQQEKNDVDSAVAIHDNVDAEASANNNNNSSTSPFELLGQDTTTSGNEQEQDTIVDITSLLNDQPEQEQQPRVDGAEDNTAEVDDEEDSDEEKGKDGKKKNKNKDKKKAKKAKKQQQQEKTAGTPTQRPPQDSEIVPCDSDVFIKVFLPLVKEHIHPRVYA